MAETIGSSASGHPNLNLTAEEKRVYGQLLKEADPDGFGAVSGDVAVKFFERTKLPADVLGQIWQIADTENRGFLTPAGFGVVLRLIGHAQAGRAPSAQLATQVSPLPRFDAGPDSQPASLPPPPAAAPLPQQTTGGPPASPSPAGGPIRVPALSPEKVAEYSSLFEKSGAENGMLSGLIAKQIFERARLPNEVLGRIWGLADTQGRGSLDVTEFVIAMHLLASSKSGQMRGVPNSLPPGLYEAAQRRPGARVGGGSRPGSSAMPPQLAPQFSGYNARPQSPIARQQVGTPLSSQSTGDGWAITPADKARFDQVFATVDRQGRGFITGDQAVEFFGNARLPEETLAQIWDLSDINSAGTLTKDEFAVAMYLIRQQRGSKDGRSILPQTLPPALIPPSMRKTAIAPSQPTAPAFENAPVTKPRSAADDLFGLDAFGSSPAPAAQPQVAQSTGGTDAGPFANPPSFQSTSSPALGAPSTFKPFVPSSSFGQSIIPQSTGSPAPSQAKSPPPADDLLGDTDPEVSSKLTNETSELGNLSNQVSTLSKQMTELQGERKQTATELTNNTAQKRAFEGRLAQLRSLYEKEVQEVKALKDQLAASKNETKRLQQDMAMIDGSHQDLATQHQQLRAALENDQRENAALKERMRVTNQETEQLKPQLEKLKSEARQQKGLVAINKKQLATNEAERDRVRAEIAAAQKELEAATREAEESARSVEESKKEIEEARSASIPSVKSPAQVASPAPSTSSNPFFRKPNDSTTFSPPIASPEQSNQNAFDSIFGPSFAAAAAPAAAAAAVAAPPTSFRSESVSPPPAQSVPVIETPTSATLKETAEPPVPPQVRQFTPSAHPFRTPLERDDSISSSVRVAPATSRLSPADTPRALTPETSTPSAKETDDPFTASAVDEEQEAIKRTLPTATASKESNEDIFGPNSADRTDDIPGAFPQTSQPQTSAGADVAASAGVAAAAVTAAAATSTNGPEKPSENAAGKAKAREESFDDIFGGPAHARTSSQQVADFDSAFADMKTSSTSNGPKGGNKEFPDIQELGDEDSDSEYSTESPLKFEDDFNTRSPPAVSPAEPTAAGKLLSAPPANTLTVRPALDTSGSNASSLPGIDAQKPPPTYGDVVPEDNPTHFPQEYKGLIPEREDPTSPPGAGGSTNTPSSSQVQHDYGPEAHPRNTPDAKPIVPAPTTAAPFDFDSAFAGAGAAPVVDDDDDDDDDEIFSPAKRQNTDFDNTFDSPPQSRPSTIPQSSGHDAIINGTSKAATAPSQPGPGSASHDWDALFAPLNTSSGTQEAFAPPPGPPPGTGLPAAPATDAGTLLAPPSTAATTSPGKETKPERPQPGRALSEGTEHDDPILKRLTAMGWSREESLAALERFDYNIDKAADFLTFRS